MRLETAAKKEGKFGDLSGHSCPCGNHKRESEICKVNCKSHPEVTSTGRNRIAPNELPSSDDRSGKIGTVCVTDTDSGECKMAVGAESDKTRISKDADSERNKTTVVANNKENEANVSIANKAIVTQREKDFSKRQEKQRDLSDDDSSNEDSENECTENKEELTRKPVLNINIPSDSVSDVENQLKDLDITQSGDGKGDLCERSPMGSERNRVRCDPPYPQVSSQVRCNGGGIVAECPAPADCLYIWSPPTFVQYNINALSEPNNNVLLPSPPEYPFGEISSSPEANNNFTLQSSQGSLYGEESCPLPEVEQKDLDAWLNDNDSNVDERSTDNVNDSQPGYQEVSCFIPPNIPSEQNESCANGVWRQPESIPSLSSPSSGSSLSSSPVPSLPDSFTGKSDSDTENEPNLPLGYVSRRDVPSCSAQSVNNRSLNTFPTSSVTHSCYPFTSELYARSQPQLPVSVQQALPVPHATNIQTVIIQPGTCGPTLRPNIQQGPVIPETVAVSARERIAARVDRAMKDRVVMTLAKLPDDQLSRGDEHGDTQLMILIANEHSHKLEKIYVMVSRLKNIPGALVARNSQNQSALSLACLFLHRMPLVARFIAEVMLEKGLPVNEVYDEGNTLLHLLCAKGDSHVNVLAELLSMKDRNSAPCFDINGHNYREGTPLHMAVKKHCKKVNCSQTVAFLLSQGADVLAQERFGGLTALHMAIKESCDPLLVQLLLQAAERRNINLVSKGDYPGDTAVHYIALRNDIALHQQARVFQLLVRYGAVSNRCGSQGRTPLALVSAERKREMGKIIHRR